MAVQHSARREYDARREIDGDRSVAETVLRAFEDAGVDHMAAEATLDEAIDTDALNQLFAGRRSEDTQLAVDLWGKRVVVTDDEVRLYDR